MECKDKFTIEGVDRGFESGEGTAMPTGLTHDGVTFKEAEFTCIVP
jgi:hypothetical protein